MQQFYPRNDEVIKVCTMCGVVKPASEFYSNKRNRDGLNSECLSCSKDRANKRYASEEGRAKVRFYYDTVVKMDIPKYLLRLTRQHAIAKNLEHSLEVEDIVIPTFCPIFGFELQLSDNGYQRHSSPSIDRIDSSRGYTKDNIAIVSWRANNIKSTATIREMELIVQNWWSRPDIFREETKEKSNKILYHARERSKSKKLDFDLDREDVLIPFECPVLGIELSVENQKQLYNSPTLDRIDSKLGYLKDNVRVISWRANDLKGDASYDEYRKVFEFYNKIA